MTIKLENGRIITQIRTPDGLVKLDNRTVIRMLNPLRTTSTTPAIPKRSQKMFNTLAVRTLLDALK